MKFTDFDDLINDAIDDKPRQRSTRTEASLRALLEAADRQFRARHDLKQAFNDAADQMGKAGINGRQQRRALRGYEGDYDSPERTDLLTGSWLRRVSTMSGSLEPTVEAVIDAVLWCEDPADVSSALAHFAKAAAKDKKIHGPKGRTLIKEFPRYGKPASEDLNEFDFDALAREREHHSRNTLPKGT